MTQQLKVKRVVGDRILIRRDLPPKQLGSIYLPDQTVGNERIMTCKGTVVDIGPLAFKDAEMVDVQTTKPDGSVVTERVGQPWCEVGDYVLYQRYSGVRIPDPQAEDGYMPDLVFIKYNDLVCVLEKAEEAQNG